MTLHKIDIAKRQIDTAGELFLSGADPIAVITLAGAAEEILGSLLRRQKKPSMYDRLIEDEFFTPQCSDSKGVNQIINGTRNALKHANIPEEDELDFEPEEAVAMLSRAMANYTSISHELTPTMLKVYETIKLRPPYSAP
jgi:hypothetical protein